MIMWLNIILGPHDSINVLTSMSHPYCNELWVIRPGKSSEVCTPSELSGSLQKVHLDCGSEQLSALTDSLWTCPQSLQEWWCPDILNRAFPYKRLWRDGDRWTKRRITENMEKTDTKHRVGQRRLWMFNEKRGGQRVCGCVINIWCLSRPPAGFDSDYSGSWT